MIELLPGVDASPIQCNIVETSLADPPDYEALSYCWGNPEMKTSILLQNKAFKITVNLFDALWCLRKENQKRLLWVDAICIDQTNIRERNHQVRLMRDIYKNACRTLIWLGRETEEIRRGLALVPIWVRAYQEKWTLRDCMWWEPDLCLTLPCLWAILENPYFARVWVVQEVVFCPIGLLSAAI